MDKLVGIALLGQSGGPTSVINASAAGVFLECLKQKEYITGVYAGKNGIKGILNEDFYDMSKEDLKEIEKLKYTPSSAIGSVRYKLKDPNEDATDYYKLLTIFKKYNIRYFFYNGGNDSMDTCSKVAVFMHKNNWECRIIGIPKTIDNDLMGTDHCPGYGSAAKYIATSMMELYLDATVYDVPALTIVEIMGRNAGWLTASSCLGQRHGIKPDLVYLPEKPFDIEVFFQDVTKILAKKNNVVVAVSEGVKTFYGKYIPEILSDRTEKDSFGHTQLGGTAATLTNLVKQHINVKARAIELSLLQRSAAHLASKVDIDEAFQVGSEAVLAAIQGNSNQMLIIDRESNNPYKINYKLFPLANVANGERKVPLEWIKDDNTGMTDEFIEYALPLIQGEPKRPLLHSLPDFAKLKRILVPKNE
jgi:6-phosphofructokinase 1